MALLITFLVVVLISTGIVSFVNVRSKGIIAVVAVVLVSVISSTFAVRALCGIGFEGFFPGSFVTGRIPVRIDALSGWFILTINFTFLTGVVYGINYMKNYREQASNLSLHWICFILVHAALVSICVLQNSIAFLVAWEIMAVSAFVLVIFEHQKTEVLSAGINYLIQSHISILFLSLAFIWVASRTNSFDFLAIRMFSTQYPLLTSLALFLCFFIGFAIKAGFVPFHTWLPHAHPVAPAHISGVMSGVIIKIGIYGILRMVLLIKSDYTIMGYIILVISVISGVYGVMLAILQHNLKKLLAYHSIENIGIIGIGIGIGCIGMGSGNQIMVVLGFGGALLHTLNHSLFKSLLFYGAGNVYQSTHHIMIDQLGGLVKRMPHTAFLFLIASLAICGLPPFNGFISEFFIYSGMFKGMKGTELGGLFILVFSVLGLTLIGGLALLCFTKAF
jgi:formate hydrogenlyase subunit 3/multisubunit Na+/H+ antiporter MnhD subunit